MKNTIYADADLNIELIANEEQDGNTIAVVIECDSAASQELTITAGTATTTEALTSGTKNTVDIPVMLWNFGDDTVITLSKGGTDAGTITIHFPGAIDSDAAINETETDSDKTNTGNIRTGLSESKPGRNLYLSRLLARLWGFYDVCWDQR